MIFVLRLKINDQQLQMLMLSFLFVILFGLFQSTKIFACYCHCFFAGVQIAYLFWLFVLRFLLYLSSFCCSVPIVARVSGVPNLDRPFGFL